MASVEKEVVVNIDHVPTHVAKYDEAEFDGGVDGTVTVVPSRVNEWTARRIFVRITATASGTVRLRVY
jgi:hypothetical protein